MNKAPIAALITISTVWFALTTPACASPTADVHAGTLGGGLGLTFGVIPNRVDLRAGFNLFNYNRSFASGTLNYDGHVKFQNAGALADWYPFDGTFRLSTGVYYNNNKFDLTATPSSSGTYTVNGTTYNAAQVGTLTGNVRFKKTAPYIGFGFGNPMRGGRLTLMFDFGAIYQGSGQVTLHATGAFANPQLANDISAAQQTAQSDMSKYRWWPVVQLGLGYRF